MRTQCRDRMLALMCESDDVLGERRHRESDQGKPLAGKSTLNRLELSPVQDKHKRYRKIEADTAGLDALLVDVFLEAENFSDGKHVEARLGMFSVPEFWERSTAR